jgi:hypothetical protein
MLHTAEIDMAISVELSDIDAFRTNTTWAICSTYHTFLKAFPGAATFGRDMLFQIPFLADWNKIGECRQRQTDQNMERENHSRCDWDYAVGDQVLLRKDGILRKGKKVRAQLGTISEQFNIRRVIPIFNNQT